jgi:SAM-dependent methyltransferase
MKKVILGLILGCSLFANEDSEKVFTDIYKNCGWGANEEGVGFSGAGSTLLNTADYVVFLEEFMRINQIKTVVDAGCGDWTFSKEVNWGDVKYLGIDVVKSVIDEDIQKYGSDNIQFECLDILRFELPSADLLICKDVLMHLSNRDIIFFLKSTKKFKHCLFTNNLGQENQNKDIERGQFRPLDLTKFPFNLNGIRLLTYSTDHGEKQVLYHGN